MAPQSERLAAIEARIIEIADKISRLQNLDKEVAELRQLCSEIDRLRVEVDGIKRDQTETRIINVSVEQKINTIIEAMQTISTWIREHDNKPAVRKVRLGDIINIIQLGILIIGLIAGVAIWTDHVTQDSRNNTPTTQVYRGIK